MTQPLPTIAQQVAKWKAMGLLSGPSAQPDAAQAARRERNRLCMARLRAEREGKPTSHLPPRQRGLKGTGPKAKRKWRLQYLARRDQRLAQGLTARGTPRKKFVPVLIATPTSQAVAAQRRTQWQQANAA